MRGLQCAEASEVGRHPPPASMCDSAVRVAARSDIRIGGEAFGTRAPVTHPPCNWGSVGVSILPGGSYRAGLKPFTWPPSK